MALLWQLDDIAFSDAVDRLEAVCRELGIDDVDQAQQIMAQAFATVSDG